MTRSILLALLLTACAKLDVSECSDLDNRADCNEAEVESGECRWVDVYKPFPDAGGCDLGESVGMCVGFSGTQTGCGVVDCAGENDPSVYQRDAGESSEVFISPVCGPEPYGDWEACEGPACACLCAVEAE